MKWNVAFACLWCVMGVMLVLGQERPQERPDAADRVGLPTITGPEKVAPDIPGVVKGGTKVQLLATWDRKHGGEGPVRIKDTDEVLFTMDDPHQIARMDLKTGKWAPYIQNNDTRVLAVVFDMKGRLLGTQIGKPGIVILTPTSRTMLADSFEGKPLTGANDLVVDMKGGVYFTGSGRENIYYVNPEGKVILATGQATPPNGIQLSADGKTVYTGNLPQDAVTAYDVMPDGRLTNRHDFAQVAEKGKPSGVDGMATDAAGRLYLTGNDEVQVVSPKGKVLGAIPFALKPRNLAFAGKDRKTLFVVARGGAFKVAMLAEGPKERFK